MEELTVNGKTLKYVGQPLDSFYFDGRYWVGKTNLLASNETEKSIIDLKSLQDCFQAMKNRMNNCNYVCGFVLDYLAKTVYYDKDEAKNHLLNTMLPGLGEDGYFINFVQKDFSS